MPSLSAYTGELFHPITDKKRERKKEKSLIICGCAPELYCKMAWLLIESKKKIVQKQKTVDSFQKLNEFNDEFEIISRQSPGSSHLLASVSVTHTGLMIIIFLR